MKIALFSVNDSVQTSFDNINTPASHELTYFTEHLNEFCVGLANGYPVVSCFVTDILNQAVLKQLAKQGTKLIALRSAGYDHVDLAAANTFGITVAYVPAYSPNAVAEHAVGLLLCLNRKIHLSYQRVLNNNFSLDGLMGFDVCEKTVGVVGTGNIGSIFAKIMRGFGCNVLACDPIENKKCIDVGVQYVDAETLFKQSDIISLHCPLLAATKHLINQNSIQQMKKSVVIVNTSRGPVIDTTAVVEALQSGHISGLAIDVYEHEQGVFFENLSGQTVKDEQLNLLRALPNVLITPHQAFFTDRAMANIAKTTLNNVTAFETGAGSIFVVTG